MRRSYLVAGGVGAVVLGGLWAVGTYVAAQRVGPPDNLGVQADGKLAPCPIAPNCVSTYADDALHAIAPIPFAGDLATARQRVIEVIETSERATIVTADQRYIHAVFRSAGFGFPDDVEFLLDPETKVIHFRSAARLGQGDLGVNRRRMEDIRQRLQPLLR